MFALLPQLGTGNKVAINPYAVVGVEPVPNADDANPGKTKLICRIQMSGHGVYLVDETFDSVVTQLTAASLAGIDAAEEADYAAHGCDNAGNDDDDDDDDLDFFDDDDEIAERQELRRMLGQQLLRMLQSRVGVGEQAVQPSKPASTAAHDFELYAWRVAMALQQWVSKHAPEYRLEIRQGLHEGADGSVATTIVEITINHKSGSVQYSVWRLDRDEKPGEPVQLSFAYCQQRVQRLVPTSA